MLRKKRSLLWIVIPIVVSGMLGLLFARYFLDPERYRTALQESLTSTFGSQVSIGKAKLSLWGGIGVSFEDFRIRDRTRNSDLLKCKRLILKMRLSSLSKREVKWKEIVLEQPALHLYRDKIGRVNLFDPPAEKRRIARKERVLQVLSSFEGGSVTVREGEISLTDQRLGDSPLFTAMKSLDLRVSGLSHLRPFPFRLDAKILHAKGEGTCSISGTIRNLSEEINLSTAVMGLDVRMKDLEISHFWPYLKSLLPMNRISGSLDLEGRYRGSLSEGFKTSAKIRLRNLVYDHPQVFMETFNPERLQFEFDLDYDLKELRVARASLELPEIQVNAKGRIYGIGTAEMGMEAEARSNPFDLSAARKFIPYRIITPPVSNLLLRGEGIGPVQLNSVKLSGKMSEIDHCDQPPYAHTLSVEMAINRIHLKLPWNLPALEGLKGHLSFKKGDLTLRAVEGRFLRSRIDRADGALLRLLLVPVLQVRAKGRLNLADLPALTKGSELSGDPSGELSAIQALTGEAGCELAVKGELKSPVRLRHQGVYHLSNLRLSHSRIPFPVHLEAGRLDLSNDEGRWSGGKVDFANSSLVLNGSWKGKEGDRLFEMAATGSIDLKDFFAMAQSDLFSEEVRQKTKAIQKLVGSGQLSLRTRRPGRGPLAFEGEFATREAFLLLREASSPFTFRDGVFSFSNQGVGLSKLRVQFGNSSLMLDGSVKEGNFNLTTVGAVDLSHLHSVLRTPFCPAAVRSQAEQFHDLSGRAHVRLKWLGRVDKEIEALQEGEVQLRGVSFRHREIPFPLSQLEGTLFFSPGEIRTEGLKGQLGDSALYVSATVSRLEPRRDFSFKVSSPQIDLDLFFPAGEKKTPLSLESLKHWLTHYSIHGTFEIDQGRFGALHFQELKAELKANDQGVVIRPLTAKAEGGNVWGEGRLQAVEKGIQFELMPRISAVEAKAFLRTLFQKGENEKILLTGKIHIDKVDLRGEGETIQEAKESLSGKLRFEVEEGVIERFNILAKIFSILNISQLLMGRLPDLTTKGLPFHHIRANIDVKEGIASTEDFLVDSDSMKITLFGKVDLGRKVIDAKMGIHPFVTVDTVLSKIPIAGYILTGKDRALISYYYEVKGDVEDPQIEAIPIKGLGENFLGIMRRLLETPFKPFQKVLPPDK